MKTIKNKTERETANCCKISQYIDDNVTVIDSWESGDGDRCVNCSQRAGIHDCDMKLNEKPIKILKFLFIH